MNRLLAYLVTAVLFLVVFLLVLEGGLRLAGLAPQPTINTFHPRLGWEKRKNTTVTRSTSEYTVTYHINALGLRDDDDLTYAKPEGTKRILFLGDSFTLGYTVDRKDLFVDLLEGKLREEGRKIQVLNGGTEGYSNDQELLWLREEGFKFAPDLVVLVFYQNDVFWNSQDHYLRFPKPLFPAEGDAEAPVNPLLRDPGKQGWFAAHTALGKMIAGLSAPLPMFRTAAGSVIPKEWGVLLTPRPDFMEKAWKHTAAVFRGLRKSCEAKGVRVLVALVPAKAQVYPRFRAEQQKRLGVPENQWNPDLPFEGMDPLLRDVGLDVVNPLARFREEAKKRAAAGETELYYEKDRHFSPEGNRLFAQVLYHKLTQNEYLGQPKGPSTPIVLAETKAGHTAPGRGVPAWLVIVLVLWVVLGGLYVLQYRDENAAAAFLKVGALIWTVAGLIALLRGVTPLLPAGWGGALFGAVALGVILFLLWKLRKRIALIFELYGAFTQRGHWYMMPLLAVMLAIGSLLIVAASSPFVAPFIYTLF